MRDEPHWLDEADVLAFHEDLLVRFGGSGGIRDRGLLESALNRPVQLFHHGQLTIHEIAAAYGAGIVKNHPFIDGNKRTGFIASALFLEMNGFRFQSSEEEAVERTLALAAGAIKEADYAAWLERTSVPLADDEPS